MNTRKVIRQADLMNISKSELLLMFIKFVLLMAFFVFIFLGLFQRIWDRRGILRFLIPFLIFSKFFFFKSHNFNFQPKEGFECRRW